LTKTYLHLAKASPYLVVHSRHHMKYPIIDLNALPIMMKFDNHSGVAFQLLSSNCDCPLVTDTFVGS